MRHKVFEAEFLITVEDREDDAVVTGGWTERGDGVLWRQYHFSAPGLSSYEIIATRGPDDAFVAVDAPDLALVGNERSGDGAVRLLHFAPKKKPG